MFVVTAVPAAAAWMVTETRSVEVDWVTADGERQRLAFDAAGGVGFEGGLPVRRFTP
ncbi:hypothetical protein ACXDF8_06455 [Mycolicibacterium sp. CBM1]